MSQGAEGLAEGIEVERRGRRFAEEDEKLPEVFLEKVLGEGQGVGQDLAERIVKRKRARRRGGLRQGLNLRFELEQKG